MKIKIIDNGMFKAPYRAHANDCGADVYSPVTVTIAPNETAKINLGFAIDVPDGYGGFIYPRSGLSAKGIVCELPPIDPHYSGNIHAMVTNCSNKHYTINAGDRVGQLVITPVVIAEFITGDIAERGDGAFGSTGV